MTNRLTTNDVYVTALYKGPERYVLLYTAATRAEALRQLARWASEPELSFTFYDAQVLAGKMGKATR
jgi:hypothetical protein